MVCLGTLSASPFMGLSLKIELHELLSRLFEGTDNFETQELCLWVLNILVKDSVIRSKSKDFMALVETKRCGWMCIPKITQLQKEEYSYSDRIARKLKHLKENLPEKPSMQHQT